MRRVAAAGGLSVGRIQHHFLTREDMLRHACQAMVDLAAVNNSANQVAGGDPNEDRDAVLERARGLLTHAFGQATGYRLGARVWAAFVAHAVVDRHIAEVVIEAQLGLEREVTRLLVLAGLDSSHALTLVALSEGLAQRTLTGALNNEDAIKEMHNVLAIMGAAISEPSRTTERAAGGR